MDGIGTMAVTTVGILLTDLAYFIPITYTPSYYIDRQHSHIGFSRFSTLLHTLVDAWRVAWLIDSAGSIA